MLSRILVKKYLFFDKNLEMRKNMLVSELKKELAKYDRKDVEKIVIELYKRIPKNKKEEYQIDDFIKNAQEKTKSVVKNVTIGELQKEIIYFLDCVDNEYYVIPNKVVPKKERSTWRFKVKRFYKELIKYDPVTIEGVLATDLLIQIYKRISIGSNRLLFSNWETFRAIGIEQVDFFEVLLNRIFAREHNEKNMKLCISILQCPSDPYGGLYRGVYDVFASHLLSVEEKNMGIKLLNDRVVELLELRKAYLKEKRQTYDLEEEIDLCTMCILDIFISLNKVDEGITYFHKYCCESQTEIKEYVLLEELEKYELYENWVTEYESHKIAYRDSLKEKYSEFKNLVIL